MLRTVHQDIHAFVPFSIESYGQLGPEAEKLLRDLVTEAAPTVVW
jgi:hypothetical protein